VRVAKLGGGLVSAVVASRACAREDTQFPANHTVVTVCVGWWEVDIVWTEWTNFDRPQRVRTVDGRRDPVPAGPRRRPSHRGNRRRRPSRRRGCPRRRRCAGGIKCRHREAVQKASASPAAAQAGADRCRSRDEAPCPRGHRHTTGFPVWTANTRRRQLRTARNGKCRSRPLLATRRKGTRQ